MSFKKLYIHQDVLDNPLVKEIKARINKPVEIVASIEKLYADLALAPDPIQKGKEFLLLHRNKGRFIKKCPGTQFYNCCGYQILHIGNFCSMDCTYCILQSYFHPPVCQFFVNHDDLFAELKATSKLPEIQRVGTGEFTDSLIWENWTDLTPRLIRWFANQTKSVLELKTKTVAIDSLRGFDHQRKTIVAWSLNTHRVIQSEERGTASLAARFRAAHTCESWGYPIAFHFDPIVIYEGCEIEYEAVIRDIFSHVSADNIAWISLGTLRFMPQLKPIIQERFPASKIPYGELIPGLDGKMRYFKLLRIQIYQHMYKMLHQFAPNVTVYFCMEDDEVWEKVMGFKPEEQGGLSAMLDASAVRHCGLKL
jgi:spore photoproduct lyase